MILGAVLKLHYINIVGFDEAIRGVFYTHIDSISDEFGHEILGIYNLADYIEKCDNNKKTISGLDKLVIGDTIVDITNNNNNDAYYDMFINMLKKDCCLNSSYKNTRDIIVILDIE